MKELVHNQTDVAIIGAGWANHLTGCCDAYENYVQRSTRMAIIGVAFEAFDPNPEVKERRDEAAVLSMTEVPGNQIIYKDENGIFFGSDGFLRACWLAADGDLRMRKLADPRPPMDMSLEKAIEVATEAALKQ